MTAMEWYIAACIQCPVMALPLVYLFCGTIWEAVVALRRKSRLVQLKTLRKERCVKQ